MISISLNAIKVAVLGTPSLNPSNGTSTLQEPGNLTQKAKVVAMNFILINNRSRRFFETYNIAYTLIKPPETFLFFRTSHVWLQVSRGPNPRS